MFSCREARKCENNLLKYGKKLEPVVLEGTLLNWESAILEYETTVQVWTGGRSKELWLEKSALNKIDQELE